MQKIAPIDYAVHNLIRERWSPLIFSEKMIREEDLKSLFDS